MQTRPNTPAPSRRLGRAGRVAAALTLLALLGACATQSAPPPILKSPRIVERDLSGTN